MPETNTPFVWTVNTALDPATLNARESSYEVYDDRITALESIPPGSSYTDEQVRDVIGVALRQTGNVTLAINDAGDTISIGVTPDANKVDSATVDNIVTLTQAAYDALGVKDARTVYFITP